MYSHGKKVDLSSVRVVYTGIRALRAGLKACIDGDTAHVVGEPLNPRAILIPLPPCNGYSSASERHRHAEIRKRFAAAIDKLTP